MNEDRGSRKPSDRARSSERQDRKREAPAGRGRKSEEARPVWQQRVARDRKPDAERSPLIPQEITPEDLDFSVRVQLKTLTEENAEMTARHLAMVNLLIDTDPELAHRHARAAANRAGRLAVVHETLGVTAYVVGDYQLALRELLTHRRLTGSNDQLPLLVDSERGMGRPERALEVVRGVDRQSLSVGVRINLAIALSGARLDLGQAEQALLELEIPELVESKVYPQSPLLFRCYAEVLTELGRDNSSWLRKADLADAAIVDAGEERFELIEEIQIPSSREVDESRLASRSKRYDSRSPRTGGDRPQRSNTRDGQAPFQRGSATDGGRNFKRGPSKPRWKNDEK